LTAFNQRPREIAHADSLPCLRGNLFDLSQHAAEHAGVEVSIFNPFTSRPGVQTAGQLKSTQ
jgi:hypothetical protein